MLALKGQTLSSEPELLPQRPPGDAFDLADEVGDRKRWRVFDQEVDMILLAVELQQLKAVLLGNPDADGVHQGQVLPLQGFFALPDHEDQVDNWLKLLAVPESS